MQHPPKKQHKRRGRVWLAAGAGLLLALSLVFVLLIPKIKEQYPAQTQQVSLTPVMMQTLEMREASEVESAVITPASGEAYALACVDGRLYLQEAEGLQDISDGYHDELLSALTQIVTQNTVAADASEVEEHLADMGLSPAKASALIRYRDGTEAAIEIGSSVPNTTYAYYRWSGDPGIYMCDNGIAEVFSLTRSHLLPVEQPVIYGSLVEEASLMNANGESRYAFHGSNAGELIAPYAYPLSADSASALTTAFQNLRLGTRECEATAENCAFYGLDDPICTVQIRQKSGFTSVIASDGTLVNEEIPAQTLRFVFGREEGEFFYTCEYEGDIYFVSRFLTQQLIEADWRSLVSRTPAAVGDKEISSLMIQTPDRQLNVLGERTERVLPNNEMELDENGNPVYETSVTINDAAGTPEQLDELADRLNRLTVSGFLPEDAGMEEQPRWSILLETEDGRQRRIEAFRMDAFTDALRVDGVMLHMIHSDAVESLTAGF